MLALQGLEDLDAPAEDYRLFDGEPEPDALLAHLGYSEFRPGQREAVEAALSGRDALVVMPTGGGKSLCYQLPGLATSDLTIVVSPLIALMSDQVRRLNRGGHPATMLASGLSDEVTRDVLEQIRDGRARILYCSPERFGSTVFLNAIAERKVDLMAIDEAHCLSEWGHDFRPDYLRLPRALERLGRPTVIACTATATEAVADEVRTRLGMSDPLMIRSGFDRPNLSFDIVPFEGDGSKGRKLALLIHALSDPENRPAIVYCGTRRDTEEVAETLRGDGIVAGAYHAGMDPDERASAQHRFMEQDLEVVVATNAFGMGIDKENVRSVWHWAIPTSVEAYYQEAGRAGRDDLPARAVLLAMRADLGRLIRFIEQREVDPEAVLAQLRHLREQAGPGGELITENPRDERERVRLAVAERAGALRLDPAPGGRLSVTLASSVSSTELAAACRVASDRAWNSYHAIKAFAWSDDCRRRSLLRHFGDLSEPEPTGRCCDICNPIDWLPDPATLSPPKTRRGKGKTGRRNGAPTLDLSESDIRLLEELKAWRMAAAGEKPAYTVANNATLEAIAATRPGDEPALAEIRGVGPAFIERHAENVLEIISSAG